VVALKTQTETFFHPQKFSGSTILMTTSRYLEELILLIPFQLQCLQILVLNVPQHLQLRRPCQQLLTASFPWPTQPLQKLALEDLDALFAHPQR
jgi:hypothetical protein